MCQNMDLASSSCTHPTTFPQQQQHLDHQEYQARTVASQTSVSPVAVYSSYNQRPQRECTESTLTQDENKESNTLKICINSHNDRDQIKIDKFGQQGDKHDQQKLNKKSTNQLQTQNLSQGQKLVKDGKNVVTNQKNIPLVPKLQNQLTANKMQTEGFRVFRAGQIIPNPKKNTCYKAIELIGTGTFGQVLSVISNAMNPNMHSPRYMMAMKVIKNQPAYINQGLIEIKNLREIAKYQQKLEAVMLEDRSIQQGKGYRNYLRLFDGFMWEGYLCIVMELMDNSILNILQSSEYKGLQMKWIEKWTKSLLVSLAKMHKIGIFHCDIKPENIMFRPQQPENPVLIDFSSSCSKNTQLFTYIQSRFYRSPEVLIGSKPYSQKIDIWSLGCVLAEMYLGLPLLPGGSGFDQLKKIWKILQMANPNRQSKGQQYSQINQIASMIQNSELGLKYFEVIQNNTELQNKQTTEKQVSFSRKRFKDQQQSIDKSAKIQIKMKTHKEYQKQYMEKAQINQQYFNLDNLADMILVRNPPAKDIQTHELFIDLIKKMLVFNPEQRISAEEAFLHPFVGGTFRELEPLRSLEQIMQSEAEQRKQ